MFAEGRVELGFHTQNQTSGLESTGEKYSFNIFLVLHNIIKKMWLPNMLKLSKNACYKKLASENES